MWRLRYRSRLSSLNSLMLPGCNYPQWIEPKVHWKAFRVQCHLSRNLLSCLKMCALLWPGWVLNPGPSDSITVASPAEPQGQTNEALGHAISLQMITNNYHLSESFSLSVCGHNRPFPSFSQSLFTKESLRAKSLLGISVYIHIEINTNYH